MVYTGGRITFGTSLSTSSTTAFFNQGYASDSTPTVESNVAQHAQIPAAELNVPFLTSSSTVNVVTVAKPPKSLLFTIEEEFSAGVSEA